MDKQGFLIPIDEVFRLAGIKFNYYASDDIFEATINNKKLTVKLGKDSFSFGNTEFKLTAGSVAAKDHILVPLGLFIYLDGFKASEYGDKDTAFLSYSGDLNGSLLTNLKILRLRSGSSEISSVGSKEVFWSSRPSEGNNVLLNTTDVIEASSLGDDYLIKTNDKVFLIYGKNTSQPEPLDVSTSAAWSLKDKYVYWQDTGVEDSYIYDVVKGVQYAIGDYYTRIIEHQGGDNTLANYHFLSSFSQENGARAITLVNWFTGASYSSIEKKGKVIVDGVIDYSPNRGKILYQNEGKYYSAGVDGSNIALIGDYDNVSWINNNRLVAYAEGNAYLMDFTGRNKIKAESAWKYVGESLDGGALFTGENSLFIEKDGQERKIMSLPWDCSYAFAQKESGPYILQSISEDGIYFTDGTKLIKSGKYSDLLKTLQKGEFRADFRKSIVFSPRGDTVAICQRENDFISISLVKPDGRVVKKITLNERTTNNSEIANLSVKWLSDTRLLVNTTTHGWIIDLEEEFQIFEWLEDTQSEIKGFITD